ncbi:hypothetical protein COOONC_23449, partial [Cooperia oncophora]
VTIFSFQNVTSNIIHDSVRVDGRGHGTIHDVQLSEKAAIHEETDSPRVAEIRAKYENKLQEVNELKDRVSIVQRRVEVLDKLVEGAGNNVVCLPKDSREPFLLNKDTLESLKEFYSFYEESSSSVRSELRKVNKILEKAERELGALQQELNRAESDWRARLYSKSIIVTLESEKGGSVQLELTYQVYNANWRPTYDLRVDTTGQQSLKITYFGNISQSTGEDWMNASLVLSTAQPCLGGQIPELGVLEAVFYRPPPPPVAQPYMARNAMLKTAGRGRGGFGSMQEQACVLDAAPMHMEMARVAEPAQHALSTEFIITKPAAIPSDGAEHKVGIINKSSSNVHEQVIVVKNSRAQPVLLTIKEQIPRSTDEKIKVRLIAPVVSQTEEANSGEADLTTAAEMPKEGCRMKGGILEWTIAVQDGKTAELHVKWAC